MILPMAGRSSGCDGAQILHQGRDLAVLAEVFLPEGCQRFLAGDLTKAFCGLFCQLVDHCLHGCSLLLILRVDRAEHNKKAPSPAQPCSQAKGTKLLNLSSAVPPGFRLMHKSGRLSERRNGAQPSCASGLLRRSHRPLRSELQRSLHPEALSAGEASLFAVVRASLLSPSLRFEFIPICWC